MTNTVKYTKNLTNFDTNKFLPYTVGFDDLFDRLFDLDSSSTGYPPYDILKLSDTKYRINMALSGFNKNNIEVEMADGELTVRSKNLDDSKQNKNFIHKGISERSFVRKFTLSDEIQVKSAEMNDGMLTVELEKIIPDHKKPKLITIK